MRKADIEDMLVGHGPHVVMLLRDYAKHYKLSVTRMSAVTVTALGFILDEHGIERDPLARLLAAEPPR